MNLTCKYSGISFKLSSFPAISLTSNPNNYIHPAIEYCSVALNSASFTHISTWTKLSDTERRLVFTNLLLKSGIVSWDVDSTASPITASDSFIYSSFLAIRPLLIWTNNLHPSGLALLPSYRISTSNSDCQSLLHGFIPELQVAKDTLRQRDHETSILRVMDRLEQNAKRNMAYGRRSITKDTACFCFSQAGIPDPDLEFYYNYLYGDISPMLHSNNSVVNLLDLEEYLENWLSHSLLKIIILRLVRAKLKSLLDFGLSLPKEYFELDEESGEYKPIYKTNSAAGFSFKVPEAAKIRTIAKPQRIEFGSVIEYAKALAAWFQL